MKKWFTLILALVVMVSSALPCCTIDDCCKEVFTESSKQHPFEEKGPCSPFFACGSCSGFTTLTRSIQVAAPVITKTTHHQQAIDLFPSAYSSGFFQPPRVVPIA